MFKFCPNCTKETKPEWKCCPSCGYLFDASIASGGANPNISLDSALDGLLDLMGEKQAETEKSALLNKLRVMIIRGKYDEAKAICDELIDNDPMNSAGYIGLIRIASKNYKVFESEEIAQQIRIAEEVFGGSSALLSDQEYAQYIAARKEVEQAKKAEAERKRLEAKLAQFTFSDNGDNTYTVTGIKDRSVSSVVIPNIVTTIGDSAFRDCYSLTSIIIPNSVMSIGDSAFYGCRSLTSITIPNSVKSIGGYAFYGCRSLTSIEIPNSVTSILEHAFCYCSSLMSVTIPTSVTSIDPFVFMGCSGLTSLAVTAHNAKYHSRENCIIDIENKMLIAGCKNSVIPSDGSVTSIGEGAFGGCSSLKSIEIPNGVMSIKMYAFCDCSSLTTITIPNSVMSIGSHAFSGCSSLTRVTIPSSVTSIDDEAFDSNTKVIRK